MAYISKAHNLLEYNHTYEPLAADPRNTHKLNSLIYLGKSKQKVEWMILHTKACTLQECVLQRSMGFPKYIKKKPP